MKKVVIWGFISLLSLSLRSNGQSHKADSIRVRVRQAKSDTEKIRQINLLAYYLKDNKPDTALLLVKQSILMCDSILPYVKGKDEKTIKTDKAFALNDKGMALFTKSDYANSLKANFESLKIYDEAADSFGIAVVSNNIGNNYVRLNENKKAIRYFTSSMEVHERLGNKMLVEVAAGNLGFAYESLNEHDEAIKYMLISKNISEEIKDEDGVSTSLLNIGNVYDNKGEIDKALEYYNQALKVKISIGDKEGIAICYDNIGKDYFAKKRFKEAADNLQKALKGGREIGEKLIVQDVYKNFALGYEQIKDYRKAYDYLLAYSNVSDTIFNEQSAQQTAQAQAQYDSEKKQKQIELLQKDKENQAALSEADVRKKRTVFISGTVIIILLAGFAFFMVNRFVVIRSQKKVIEEQKGTVEEKNIKLEEAKAIVEEKNKDILDSINYARRLQDAILPPINLVKQYLPESFLLYKPKDIVAGDFYWMERAGDNTLIAAADCTGHGVPGALVSVVCSNALNRTVKEFKITEPGKILDKVRELVLETFEKSESNVQDGMDISLCCINAATNEIQWSGAYNSLWYISESELKELPADKQPIGKVDNPSSFTTYTLKLKKGDMLYLFTDGYADQFGGPKGKKFKYKQMGEKLLTFSKESMEAQKQLLDDTFNEWKGDLEQIDDVLVIGVRI